MNLLEKQFHGFNYNEQIITQMMVTESYNTYLDIRLTPYVYVLRQSTLKYKHKNKKLLEIYWLPVW